MPSKPQTSRKRVSSNRLLYHYRKSHVPPEGWSADTFTGSDARNLLNDILKTQKVAVARGVRSLSEWLSKRFEKLIQNIITRAFEQKRRLGSVQLFKRISVPETEFIIDEEEDLAVWERAVDEESSDFDAELFLLMLPRYQSVASEVLGKSSVLLGFQTPANTSGRILQRVRTLAAQVTGINATTRARLARVIQEGVEKGLSVEEIAINIRAKFPTIAANRVTTIARTEMVNAANQGASLAYELSGVVTHVSVVGCQAIEKNIPTYYGVPTCNIQNVPVKDSWSLQFHPNHTGIIVPAAFRGVDGSVLPLKVRRGAG